MSVPYTLRDIRRAIGADTGEMMLLPATDAGSTSTFIDSVHLLDRQDNANSLMNRILYFSGGTPENIGHEARVRNFSKSPIPTLTFKPDAPAATQALDEAELWSNWTRFGSIPLLHQLINDGIRSVAHLAGPRKRVTIGEFDYQGTHEIEIPSTWVEFGGADVQDLHGRWMRLSERFLKPYSDGEEKILTLKSTAARNAARNTVRIWGYEAAPLLTNETDTTTVNFMWLRNAVAGALRLGTSWRASDRAAEERLSAYWATEAKNYLRAVGGPHHGMQYRL